MPIYEYECTACGEVIEVIQKINSRRAPGRCEKCSGKLKKKISRASFQLKGGGWYSDGYGNGGAGAGAGATGSGKASKSEKKESDDKSSKSKKAASA